MHGTGQIHWPNFDPFHPTIRRRTLMVFVFVFLLLTPSQHYLLYPRVVSTSSTCERLSLRCIINRGRFVEPFAVRFVSTSRRPNYRRDRLSFCLARSFSRSPCLPLHAALAMHDDATISLPRHFSILCCSFLDGPSLSTQKVFSMPASAFDLAFYVSFFFFFSFFIAWCFGVFSFLLFVFPACYYCFSSTKWSTFLVGRGQGMRRCEDAKIAIHDCAYIGNATVLK